MAASSSAAGPAAAAAQRSWSELPVDVLASIVSKLSTPSLPGVVLVSGVCSSWRQATLGMPVGEVAYRHLFHLAGSDWPDAMFVHEVEARFAASFSSWLRRYGPGVQRLSYRGFAGMAVAVLRDVAGSGALPRLQSLALDQLRIDAPPGSDLLRELPQLQELQGACVALNSGAAGWRALRGFRRCTALTKLQLHVEDWEEQGDAANKSLRLWGCMPTSLRCLDLRASSMPLAPHLTALTGLQELRLTVEHDLGVPEQLQAALPPALSSFSIGDICGYLLPSLPALSSVLRSLTIWSPDLDDHELDEVDDDDELDEMDDDDELPVLQHLPNLRQLTALTSLRVVNTPVLQQLFLPGLQELTWERPPELEDATDLHHLSALSSLRTLRLFPDDGGDFGPTSSIDAQAADAVGRLHQLTRLVLQRPSHLVCKSDAWLCGPWEDALQRLVQLKDLEVDEGLLSEYTRPWLTALTQLTALTLNSVSVYRDAAGLLQLEFPNLIEHLQQAAAACGQLSRVVVRGVEVVDAPWATRPRRTRSYPPPRRFDLWVLLQAAVPALLVEVVQVQRRGKVLPVPGQQPVRFFSYVGDLE